MRRFAHWKHFRFAQNREHGEQGSTLVETAMAAMLLLIAIFGVMEISLALYTYHVISEAAREGTRYAIVRGSASCADNTPGCKATSAEIQTYIQGLGITPTGTTATTTWPTTGASCTPSSNPCNNPGNLVLVTVKYSLVIPFVPAKTFTLSSASEMVISQ